MPTGPLMCTMCTCFAQIRSAPGLVNEWHDHRSFANGQRHPVHGAGANVASLEHAGRAGLEGHWFAALQQRAYLASGDIDLLLCRYRGRESQEKDRPSAQAACSSRNLLSQSISRWRSSSGYGITEFSYDTD